MRWASEVAGKIIANIGGDDEIGPAFSEGALCDKFPINFSLPCPTPVHCLDPIFYAHNLAPHLITKHYFEPGYHPFPADLDQAILNEWSSLHSQPIDLLDWHRPSKRPKYTRGFSATP